MTAHCTDVPAADASTTTADADADASTTDDRNRLPVRWDAVTARRVGIAIGAARAGIGVFMLVTPRLLPPLFGAPAGVGAQAAWITRMTGWREIALGGGAAVALARREPPALWLVGQVLVDLGDAVTFAGGTRSGGLPARKTVPQVLQALSWAALLAAAVHPLTREPVGQSRRSPNR